jgi:hypothetical protein
VAAIQQLVSLVRIPPAPSPVPARLCARQGAGNHAGHADRFSPLRRYLIAAICSLARPDAIFDMSVERHHSWLSASYDWFVCSERKTFDQAQQIDVTEQVRAASVCSAWMVPGQR